MVFGKIIKGYGSIFFGLLTFLLLALVCMAAGFAVTFPLWITAVTDKGLYTVLSVSVFCCGICYLLIKKILKAYKESPRRLLISFLKKFKREYKVKRKKVFLEKKELEDVLNFFEQSDKELFYIIKFLTVSALRVNDLLEIKFDSINENFINFKNHKRNIFCKLILNNELKDIINYQKIKLKSIRENKKNFNKENYLFFNEEGKKYEYHILQHRLLQYKKMRLHFHIFRHTCAAIMREQDFSIEMISKKLHHANISTTTMYYLHDTEEKIKKDFKRFAEMQILK